MICPMCGFYARRNGDWVICTAIPSICGYRGQDTPDRFPL